MSLSFSRLWHKFIKKCLDAFEEASLKIGRHIGRAHFDSLANILFALKDVPCIKSIRFDQMSDIYPSCNILLYKNFY